MACMRRLEDNFQNEAPPSTMGSEGQNRETGSAWQALSPAGSISLALQTLLIATSCHYVKTDEFTQLSCLSELGKTHSQGCYFFREFLSRKMLNEFNK